MDVAHGMGTVAGAGNSTNAIGSSGVDPGRSLVSMETYPSTIEDSLDVFKKSCDGLDLSSSSILAMHRIIDKAVWGGGTEITLMRPTYGSLESAGCFDKTAPRLL